MSQPGPDAPDPVAVVAEIRAEVAARRARGEYPAELVARLEAEFEPVEAEKPLEAIAHLRTVRPLGSERRLAGRAAVFAKRAVRRGIAWYVRPIAEDQTRVNFSVVRRLYDIEARLGRLEALLARDAPGPVEVAPPGPAERPGEA